MTVAAVCSQSSPLDQPVTALFGVGPERAAQLERLGIRTIEELLLHRPSRYEDRAHLRRIAELQAGESATVRGQVVALGTKWYRKHSKSIFEIVLSDGTGRLHCRWWNLPYMEKYFAVGNDVLVFGKVLGLKPRIMDHPETEVIEEEPENLIHLNRLTPIYPLTEGLPQRWLRSLLWRTLGAYEGKIQDPWPLNGQSAGTEPQSTSRDRPRAGGPEPPSAFQFPSRSRALRMLHFPESAEQPELARRRLALDEFISLQCGILRRRKNLEANAVALPCGGDNHLIRPFLANLEFSVTPAQTRVLRELRAALSGAPPMRRLLQGDVGSGKTVVAACCALMTIESGFSVALMAPTEILAEQHYRNFSRWFGPLGLEVALLTGSRRQHASQPVLTIGTHALIERQFTAENLGLVIIDEQHKFGVAQRERLVRKGRYPHLLVMTATPIPRTLGLTVYGDLDVSVITELPPGRGRVKTFVRTADKLPKVWEFMRAQLKAGRQAYVVYPRVDEEGGATGVKAVTKEFANLRDVFQPAEVGLVHGRLAGDQKEAAMARFRSGNTQVLLATSLIEVGVDVPNATVMLIENAEQFGLAQLHQLRGRIGRGAAESYCILVSSARTEAAQQRLRILEQTTDGFQIAEADLKMRGPGELLGQQQSGAPRFRFGELTTDWELLRMARDRAAALLGAQG